MLKRLLCILLAALLLCGAALAEAPVMVDRINTPDEHADFAFAPDAPLVEVFFPREKLRQLNFLRSSPRRTVLFLLIFMVPGTPKDLLCWFVGLTDMKLPVLLLICTLGRLPAVITSTVGGNALGDERYWFAVIVFAATFVLSITGLAIYNRICKKQQDTD